MTFRTAIKVRFDDEDHAGIVYFPRFFHFFHVAFEDFFGDQGIPYRQCLDVDRLGWPAVKAESEFLKPVRFGDVLLVDIEVERLGTSSATFVYRAKLDGDEGDRARAKITVACIDMGTFRATPIPPKYRALFEAHLAGGGAR